MTAPTPDTSPQKCTCPGTGEKSPFCPVHNNLRVDISPGDELDEILTDHRVRWLNMLSELNDELISVPEMLDIKAEIIKDAKDRLNRLMLTRVVRELKMVDPIASHKLAATVDDRIKAIDAQLNKEETDGDSK